MQIQMGNAWWEKGGKGGWKGRDRCQSIRISLNLIEISTAVWHRLGAVMSAGAQTFVGYGRTAHAIKQYRPKWSTKKTCPKEDIRKERKE